MAGGLVDRILSWSDANLATLGHWFMREWSKVERSYRRPFSRIVFRLKFAFFPLLAVGAIASLAWDWSHARWLGEAEDAIFDYVVQWRPFEPTPSGQVVVVEIDECSIEHFRARGEGGWPWSRQRHADLLDQLDRAGMNPLALYSLLQKLTALGSDSAALAELYKTHPPFDDRIDRIDERGFGALEPYTMRQF